MLIPKIRLSPESVSPERTVYCTHPAGLPQAVAAGGILVAVNVAVRVVVAVFGPAVLVNARVEVGGGEGDLLGVAVIRLLLPIDDPLRKVTEDASGVGVLVSALGGAAAKNWVGGKISSTAIMMAVTPATAIKGSKNSRARRWRGSAGCSAGSAVVGAGFTTFTRGFDGAGETGSAILVSAVEPAAIERAAPACC